MRKWIASLRGVGMCLMSCVVGFVSAGAGIFSALQVGSTSTANNVSSTFSAVQSTTVGSVAGMRWTLITLPVRKFDGSNNHLQQSRGSVGSVYQRVLGTAYADGYDEPAGPDRPTARLISNQLFDQSDSLPNPWWHASYLWQRGQFLDHDITLTHVQLPYEPFPIPVPTWDPRFDPRWQGGVMIPLDRSAYEPVNSVRQQIDATSSFIDGSVVYGATKAHAWKLRTLDGTGRLKTSTAANWEVIPPLDGQGFFFAGDERINEQSGLIALHTLFIREHNYRAEKIKDLLPQLNGDQIYLLARDIVTAEIQAITYREYLPLILGDSALSPYQWYNDSIDATISNVFAAAAFRFGHTQLPDQLFRIASDGQEAPEGHLALHQAFFAPEHVIKHGVDTLLRGLNHQQAETIDTKLVSAIRNMLFGPPGAGGMDLAALNIQRGRDHGLPSLTQARAQLGLSPYSSFTQISSDLMLTKQLADTYWSIDQIDLRVGLLAEDEISGAVVGETLYTLLVDQFERLRDGDRFRYEWRYPDKFVAFIEQQTLKRIILRNSSIQADQIAANPFLVP